MTPLVIDKMGTDIVEQVVNKVGCSFSIQLDESSDVSGNAQLVAFVRYIDTNDICEHILFFAKFRGENNWGVGGYIFNVNPFFIENGLS